MNHRPTRLALLISLIGAGMAPGAHASVNPVDLHGDRTIGSMLPLAGVPCDPIEAFALAACGTATEPGSGSLSVGHSLLATPFGVRLLPATPGDDWAPGEATRETQHSAWPLVPASSPASEMQPVPSSELHAVREAGRLREAREPSEARDRGRVRETLRVKPRQQAGASRKPRLSVQMSALTREQLASIGQAELVVERVARLAVPTVTPTLQHTEATATQTDRLLDSLAAVLHESHPAPAGADTAEMPVEVSAASEATHRQAAARSQIERTPAEVETQTNRVLRQLGAIMADERDEVGAARLQAPGAAATSQSDKVFLMLGEITSSAQRPAEDGAERRLRKLAARAAQAEAKAAAEAAAALTAEIARVGVDLMLPLELPAPTASPAPSFAAPQAQPAAAVVETAVLPVDGRSAQPDTATEAATPGSLAAARAPRRNPFGDDRRVAVAEDTLDRVRGGFSVNGLNISFGIERAVYVNGALVTTTSLNISDLGRITAGRGTTAFDAGTIGLIQSGAGNVVSPTMISAGSVGTVVQNTLDGQKIQNITVINATSNSLGVLKGLNLQSSLRGAVIDSLRR